MDKRKYTREEVLKMIEEAFWSGVEQGGEEYAGDCFIASSYLIED